MLVGADDPVRPQKNLFFTKISGEFDTSQGRTEASAPTEILKIPRYMCMGNSLLHSFAPLGIIRL